MKNKKGFTLVEILAVIVILGILMVIVSRAVMNNINESKKRVRFLAAKEITEMAEAYMVTEGGNSVTVPFLITQEYIESDATNPATGENGGDFTNQEVKKELSTLQDGYEEQTCGSSKCYKFDGYIYYLN